MEPNSRRNNSGDFKNRKRNIAYADDIAIVIGNTRKELEQKANTVTETLKLWCQKQKLELSAKKSQKILLKGSLDTRRPPIESMGNNLLKMIAETKYLGIHYGSRLNITPHVNYINKEIFNHLAGISKTTWGLNTKTMWTL